jgi:hypothetical protein
MYWWTRRVIQVDGGTNMYTESQSIVAYYSILLPTVKRVVEIEVQGDGCSGTFNQLIHCKKRLEIFLAREILLGTSGLGTGKSRIFFTVYSS